MPGGERLWQCGNGRWHEFPPRGVPFSMKCGWGLMEYYDARVAHEAARRIRYRIPHGWEWLAVGGVLFSEAFADGAAWALGAFADGSARVLGALARLVTLWPW